ncbi:hypothetical protein NJB1507_44810 [Mycobacterium marinum]|uniref:hypothetical protein n=1 Tax=Mycobacterium marinum TaxID=1781 RepID=UPI0021C30E84|nr:hypothetical protein [Mycobacterium marinum]GJO33251.1 hypothetical protein NJB1507_44810 [Mycobacterium marinum]
MSAKWNGWSGETPKSFVLPSKPSPIMSPDDDESPDPPTATTDGEATTIAPPPTVVASELAWSLDDDSTAATTTPRSWRSVWTVAGLGVLGAAAAAGVIAAIGVGKDTGSVQGAPGPDTTEETALLPPPPAGAASPPSAPATVTVTPTPLPTITVEANPRPPPNGRTDIFTVCPDGHEGVVGGHTTCAFAQNVRSIFYATGMANTFTAFSPVTGKAYKMNCVGRYPAYFTDGSMMISTRCYGANNAEVVIW